MKQKLIEGSKPILISSGFGYCLADGAQNMCEVGCSIQSGATILNNNLMSRSKLPVELRCLDRPTRRKVKPIPEIRRTSWERYNARMARSKNAWQKRKYYNSFR